MSTEVTLAIIGCLSTFASGFSAWFFTRKKQSAELKSGQQDFEIKMVEKYDNVIDSLTKRLEGALQDLEEATVAIRDRDKTITELQGMLHKYETIVKGLNDTIESRNAKIQELISTVEELTAELKKYKQLNRKTE